MEEIYDSFLGKGWAFPPSFSSHIKQVLMVKNEEDIEQSLHILLTTTPGERLMLPEYGCDLNMLVFQQLDRSLLTFAADLIETAIYYHEPRIKVDQVHIEVMDEYSGLVHIHIAYTIRHTNTRRNMVYPFYLKEGTNI